MDGDTLELVLVPAPFPSSHADHRQLRHISEHLVRSLLVQKLFVAQYAPLEYRAPV